MIDPREAKSIIKPLAEQAVGNSLYVLDSPFLDTNETYKYILDCTSAGQSIRTVPQEVKDHLNVIREEFETEHNLSDGIRKTTSTDYYRIWSDLRILKRGGKAAVVISHSSLINKSDITLRKFMISFGLIEAVISLPVNLFSANGIATDLVIISRGNTGVRLIDATQICVEGRRRSEFSDDNIQTIVRLLENNKRGKSCYVANDQIISTDESILSPEVFLQPKKRVGVRGRKSLGEITLGIQRGARCTAAELDSIMVNDQTDYIYLPLNAIQDGVIDKGKIKYLIGYDKKYEKCVASMGDILISKTVDPLKVAIVDDGKMLINVNMFILKIDPDQADPYYVRAYFDTYEGREALRRIATGKKDLMISNGALSEIMIQLPGMDEQKRIGTQYKEKMEELMRLKTEVDRISSDMKNVFFG